MNTKIGAEMTWKSLNLGGHLGISRCTYVNVLRWLLKWTQFFKLSTLRLWRVYEYDSGPQLFSRASDLLPCAQTFKPTGEKCIRPKNHSLGSPDPLQDVYTQGNLPRPHALASTSCSSSLIRSRWLRHWVSLLENLGDSNPQWDRCRLCLKLVFAFF